MLLLDWPIQPEWFAFLGSLLSWFTLLILRNTRQSRPGPSPHVGLQDRCVPQMNMKAHPLLRFTTRLQLCKQSLPSWLSSQAWFLVIRATKCLSGSLILFSSWDWQHIWCITRMYRETTFQSCWICLWAIKINEKREGCSADVLKSYSVMSTSPQACALTPESLVSHRDLLQVYTELWPWSFVGSLFFFF